MVKLSDLPPEKAEQLLCLPLPSFATMPWVEGPSLPDTRLAVVSTAGIHLPDENPFHLGEAGYRSIPNDATLVDLVMSHVSPNFDRTGFEADPNVVFPMDLLREMEEEGALGSLAEMHYSFMGATDPRAMEPDAVRIASRMKKDGVNAVLLVPVWPNCTRAVGALGHYLETEGLATTQISLIKEHTAAICPPRALWVPYMLGRPLGNPGDIEGQKSVLKAVLGLLEMKEGPVLEEY